MNRSGFLLLAAVLVVLSLAASGQRYPEDPYRRDYPAPHPWDDRRYPEPRGYPSYPREDYRYERPRDMLEHPRGSHLDRFRRELEDLERRRSELRSHIEREEALIGRHERTVLDTHSPISSREKEELSREIKEARDHARKDQGELLELQKQFKELQEQLKSVKSPAPPVVEEQSADPKQSEPEEEEGGSAAEETQAESEEQSAEDSDFVDENQGTAVGEFASQLKTGWAKMKKKERTRAIRIIQTIIAILRGRSNAPDLVESWEEYQQAQHFATEWLNSNRAAQKHNIKHLVHFAEDLNNDDKMADLEFLVKEMQQISRKSPAQADKELKKASQPADATNYHDEL